MSSSVPQVSQIDVERDRETARRANAGNVDIREASNKGRGVYAARRFLAGETVIFGLVESLTPARTPYSIQLDARRHALFEAPAVMMNHSCDPNVFVRDNAFGAYDFIALRDVEIDEEINFDYATTEQESIAVKTCLCASAACRGAAGGYSTLSPHHALRAAGRVAAYLREGADASAHAR